MPIPLYEIFTWLNVLVAASGAVVSSMHLKRSPWVALLLGGFVLEAALSALYGVAYVAIRNGTISGSTLALASVLTSAVGIIARGSIVGGLACVLSELPRSSPSAPPSETSV